MRFFFTFWSYLFYCFHKNIKQIISKGLGESLKTSNSANSALHYRNKLNVIKLYVKNNNKTLTNKNE